MFKRDVHSNFYWLGKRKVFPTQMTATAFFNRIAALRRDISDAFVMPYTSPDQGLWGSHYEDGSLVLPDPFIEKLLDYGVTVALHGCFIMNQSYVDFQDRKAQEGSGFDYDYSQSNYIPTLTNIPIQSMSSLRIKVALYRAKAPRIWVRKSSR